MSQVLSFPCVISIKFYDMTLFFFVSFQTVVSLETRGWRSHAGLPHGSVCLGASQERRRAPGIAGRGFPA